ncbi:DNA-directed RNA polymerase subunit alpha C-terminal domain-containing protein [Streptodolium elevatio]
MSEHDDAVLCCHPVSFSPLPIPIEDLELPLQAYAFLKRSGVRSVGDLVERYGTGRPGIPHLTAQDVDALRNKLAAVGIRLDEPDGADPDVGARQSAAPPAAIRCCTSVASRE